MQSNKSTFTKRTLKLLVLIIITGVPVALWLDFRTSPEQMIQRALAIKLPESAARTRVYYYWMPDSKIIQLWAVMDIPLEGAETLAHDLDLPLAQSGHSIVFSNPNPPHPTPAWWSVLKQADVDAVSTKWLKQTPGWQPAFLAMVWTKGKLYIFDLGVFDATK